MCPLFLKSTTDVLALHLSVVFRQLVHMSNFPTWWRQANVTHIPKGSPSSSVASSVANSSYQIDHIALWHTLVGVNWLTSCPEYHRDCFIGQLLFLLYSAGLFSILENKLIGYADDHFDRCCVIPGVRVTVVESLGHDLVKVCAWCDLWVMKLNATKSKTMIVYMSCTVHPQSAALIINTIIHFIETRLQDIQLAQ